MNRPALQLVTAIPAVVAVGALAAIALGRGADEKPDPGGGGQTKEEPAHTVETKPEAESDESPAPVVQRTEAEWREVLTPEQFRVTRQAGTERPWGPAYDEFKHQGEGTYYCVGCGAELFTSDTKFDSRCGWPSFYDPAKAKNITTRTDHDIGYPRTEVLCARCAAHLGHVFVGEGFDTPTDKRYCINAVAMKFVPAGVASPEVPKPATGGQRGDDAPAEAKD